MLEPHGGNNSRPDERPCLDAKIVHLIEAVIVDDDVVLGVIDLRCGQSQNRWRGGDDEGDEEDEGGKGLVKVSCYERLE